MQILGRVDATEVGAVLLSGVVLDQVHLNDFGRPSDVPDRPVARHMQGRRDRFACAVDVEPCLLIEIALLRCGLECLQVWKFNF